MWAAKMWVAKNVSGSSLKIPNAGRLVDGFIFGGVTSWLHLGTSDNGNDNDNDSDNDNDNDNGNDNGSDVIINMFVIMINNLIRKF